ncbi:unnamed protein product [Musa acuminata subsp. burmannicoides]
MTMATLCVQVVLRSCEETEDFVGWANESDSANADKDKGWAGVQAIPRAVWLDSNGRQLVQWPIEELETLRHKHGSVKNRNILNLKILNLNFLTRYHRLMWR